MTIQWFNIARLALCAGLAVLASGAGGPAIPILVYHRLGPVQADPMTVTIQHFKEQLDLLAANSISVIPLSRFLDWRMARSSAPPPNSVILTFDDGHVSFYRDARIILEERALPATLFVYPSCISRVPYAMTWDQVSEIAANPSFDIESHTFWHPNFKTESKHLSASRYQTFVDAQLKRSKEVLSQKSQHPVHLLAWPFGIYDPFLMSRASAAGYEAAFSIECRAATSSDPLMSIPRCLVADEFVGARFLSFIKNAVASAAHKND